MMPDDSTDHAGNIFLFIFQTFLPRVQKKIRKKLKK